jgi:hypothetical protein
MNRRLTEENLMKRITGQQLEDAVLKYADGAPFDLYKGRMITGGHGRIIRLFGHREWILGDNIEYGWIIQLFGHNEQFLGKNIADAYEKVMSLITSHEEAKERELS